MKAVLSVLFLLFSVQAFAEEVPAWGISLYAASDWSHATGTPGQKKYLETRIVFTEALSWAVPYVSVGTHGDWTVCGGLAAGVSKRFYLGGGLCHGPEDDKVGDEKRFQLFGGVPVSNRWSIEYMHFQSLAGSSHRDETYRFLGGRYQFWIK